MPQVTKQPFDETRIPFNQMTFSPDVPSTQLGANEYNAGLNVEADVRGIRSVSGEQEILATIPGTPTFVTGGFRQDTYFWFIVATDEGKWWANRGDNHTNPTGNGGVWIDITPNGATLSGYNQGINITDAWNGTVPFFNDAIYAPMFWPDNQVNVENTTGASGNGTSATLTFAAVTPQPYNVGDTIIVEGVTPAGYNGVHTVTAATTTSVSWLSTQTGSATVEGTISGPIPKMIMYSQTLPASIASITTQSPTVQRVTFSAAYATVPYSVGDKVNITGVNQFFNGIFTVTGTPTTTYVDVTMSPGGAYPGGSVGNIAPQYSWNYTPGWASSVAGFVRMYSTPNVGNILVAGNITATLTNGTTQNYETTVQWSQSFGLNQAPNSWTPTVVNVANQLEIPLRGPVLDAFPCNGLFFLQSYWDTVVFSPINYTTTSAPILGVRLFSPGRGLLTANCWAVADNLVYGIDARDIWVFDGQSFKGLGNQRVKNWFFDQLDPRYVDRIYMQVNTQKNQVELYYSTVDAVNGVPNRMLSYRYDIDCWNAPREVYNATFATESPVWTGNTNTYPNLTPINISSSGSGCLFNVTQFGTQYTISPVGGTQGSGYALGDTLKITGDLVGGTTPANDITITVEQLGPAGGSPTGIDYTTAIGNASGWNTFNPGSRCVVYVRGVTNTRPVQKDQGFSNLDSNPITSTFTRDNIKMLPNYSGKLMVHRILPEIVNLDGKGLELDPTLAPTEQIGGVAVTIKAANSVGQTPQAITEVAVNTNTDSPWAQIDQNAYRVNSLSLSNESNLNTWMCSATTWQYTQVEDDR
jgi:hypothetical protein